MGAFPPAVAFPSDIINPYPDFNSLNYTMHESLTMALHIPLNSNGIKLETNVARF